MIIVKKIHSFFSKSYIIAYIIIAKKIAKKNKINLTLSKKSMYYKILKPLFKHFCKIEIIKVHSNKQHINMLLSIMHFLFLFFLIL